MRTQVKFFQLAVFESTVKLTKTLGLAALLLTPLAARANAQDRPFARSEAQNAASVGPMDIYSQQPPAAPEPMQAARDPQTDKHQARTDQRAEDRAQDERAVYGNVGPKLRLRAMNMRPSASVNDEWARGAHFFGGIRSSLAFPPGGMGPATTVGVELGVAAQRGLGFGLHVYGVGNPSGMPLLEVPAAAWGVGASADVRWYLQTIKPLTLYPTLSLGFLAGPDKQTNENVVLPMINPGFGARVNIADAYVACEIGLASLYMPFVGVSFGWEPQHKI